MKSLRTLSTLGVLAICTVFASAQDSGLGRGHGGQRDRDSGSSRQTPPPSSNSSDRSSSRQDSGHSRDRSPDPKPTQGSQDRPKDRAPDKPAQSSPDRSRDRSPDRPSQSSPDRSRDRSPDRPSQTSPDRSRDRSPDRPSQTSPDRSRPPVIIPDRNRTGDTSPSQDGGLGRGGNRGGGSTGSSQGGGTRDSGSRDRNTGGSGSTRDTGSRDRNTGGSTRDNGGTRDQGGRDPGLGRGGGSSSSGRDTTAHSSPGRIHNEPSRSGSVAYKGSNNVEYRNGSRGNFNAPNTYGIIKSPSMENRARREDGLRGGYNGWRSGYYHYNPSWVDSYFWYPHYCFSPFGNVNIVISPWYSYSFLPGYLSCDHVYVNNYRGYWGWNTGAVYVYDSYNYGYNDRSNSNQQLNYSIEDLRNGFERRDFRALDRLVPNYGQIAIYRDGRYDYSIDSRDFSDLLNDLSTNADTDRYRILETRTNRGSARISAIHEYIDQWGNHQRVYHSIYLEQEDGRMVIREFGTSNSRVW